MSKIAFSEELAKATVALCSLTVGVTVFMILNNVVLNLPTVIVGGSEVVLTSGYLLYVGVRVAGAFAAGLFYLSFGDRMGNFLKKKIVSWHYFVLVIAGLVAVLFVDYALL